MGAFGEGCGDRLAGKERAKCVLVVVRDAQRIDGRAVLAGALADECEVDVFIELCGRERAHYTQ